MRFFCIWNRYIRYYKNLTQIRQKVVQFFSSSIPLLELLFASNTGGRERKKKGERESTLRGIQVLGLFLSLWFTTEVKKNWVFCFVSRCFDVPQATLKSKLKEHENVFNQRVYFYLSCLLDFFFFPPLPPAYLKITSFPWKIHSLDLDLTVVICFRVLVCSRATSCVPSTSTSYGTLWI